MKSSLLSIFIFIQVDVFSIMIRMRGIFSEGMIMCATGPDQVKPLIPPEGSVIGDRVRLQGYTGILLSVPCFKFCLIISLHV